MAHVKIVCSDWTADQINGFKVVPEKGYRDFTVGYDPVPGEFYYLLYAVYTTGDSFGRSATPIVHYIDLFKSLDLAKVALKEAAGPRKTDVRNYQDQVSFSYVNDAGQTVSDHKAWLGYFEDLDRIEIKPIVLLNDEEQGMIYRPSDRYYS